MSCACFGGNGGGIVSCICGADDERFGHAPGGDPEEGACCKCGGDGDDVFCTSGGDGEDVCRTSGEDGEAVGGADVSFGGRDPSRDSLKLSSCSVKSKHGKN